MSTTRSLLVTYPSLFVIVSIPYETDTVLLFGVVPAPLASVLPCVVGPQNPAGRHGMLGPVTDLPLWTSAEPVSAYLFPRKGRFLVLDPAPGDPDADAARWFQRGRFPGGLLLWCDDLLQAILLASEEEDDGHEALVVMDKQVGRAGVLTSRRRV